MILLLLWFFLVNLRERYLELELRGWGEMSLGVFLIFLGSLLELAENLPDVQKYLYAGDMPWGEFSKISFYVIGVILVIFSPVNWLPLILEAKSSFKPPDKKSKDMNSFLSELDKSVNKADKKKSSSQVFNSALTYMCAELKADAGAVFLFPDDPEKRLNLSYFQGLSSESVDNFMRKESTAIEIFTQALRDRKIVTSGDILNSDRKLALAVKEDGFESCICIPLFSEEENLGLMVLFSKSKYHFENFSDDGFLELAMALAEKIQHLRKMNSLEQREEEIRVAEEKERFLRLISEDLLKAKEGEVLHRIVQAGSEIFHPCDCKIFIWDGKRMILKATSEPELTNEEINFTSDDWLKDAIQDKELKILSDEQYLELRQKGLKKLVVAPLEKFEEFMGLIVLGCKTKEDAFSSFEIGLIKTLALLASKALEKSYINKTLEQKENLLSSLLDSIEDLVTIHDKNQKIVRINKAGLRFLNLTEEEVLGRNCFEILYRKNQPEDCPCYLSFKEKKPCFQQIKLAKERTGKEGWLKVWTQPLLNDRGEVEMVMEYAKFEETPEILTEVDTGKKEVPKEFFNNLNNILAGILGNVELVMIQLKQYKEFNISSIRDQINLIEELVIEGSKLIREVKGEKIKLPDKETIAERKIDVEEEKKVSTSLKILAIDDQKIILDLLESILQGLGHQVKVTLSGKEGLEFLQRDGYDLVITDLGMPDMSGWEVSRRVKEMKKNIPVVMITGWGVTLEMDKIREFGVDYLLPKPFKVEQLSRLIDQIHLEKLKEKPE